MNLSEEWKTQFPVGMVPNAPLLCSNSTKEVSKTTMGPLCFNPEPHRNAQLLFASPSLCPPIIPPYPRLSLHRFLSTSSITPKLSSSLCDELGTVQNFQDDVLSVFSQNRLQILPCPGNRSGLIFIPNGSNHDQIGFLSLSVENSTLSVKGSCDGTIILAEETFYSRIKRILVSPVDDIEVFWFSSEIAVTIGFLMAYTLYSVHWYAVAYSESCGKPSLKYLGYKQFKSCSIAGACWSPHLAEECLVLLENGVIFLFDMTNEHSRGKKLNITWDEQSGSENDKWLGVEFSWHPRIFLVARSDKVFLVDLRSGDCKIRCLANIDTISDYTSFETRETFITFSRAGEDGFRFILVSNKLLFLCDVRDELKPILHWSHGIEEPSYVNVYNLSEMRSSGSRVSKHGWADESGSCIILGSFWNSEFAIFCYGPSPSADERENVLVAKQMFMPLYSWELPSKLLLSDRECPCGDCILREEMSRESFPDWIDWHQKKETVLGFEILNRHFPDIQTHSNYVSGFVLIRLMSSGKLEAQNYSASWDLVKVLKAPHTDSLRRFDHNNLMYNMDNGEYKFQRKFTYLKLRYLSAYLSGKLSEILELRNGERLANLEESTSSFSPEELHKTLCKQLQIYKSTKERSTSAVSVVFDDVPMPSSIFEIGLRQKWASIPTELLMLAFSGYTEINDVQLPPFFLRESCRSSKLTNKLQPGILPLPVLLTLDEFHNGSPSSQEKSFEFSADSEISKRCTEVSEVLEDKTNSEDNSEAGDKMRVDSQKTKPFISYQTKGESSYGDQTHSTLVFRLKSKESKGDGKVKKPGLEMFDDLSPIDLKFDDRDVSLGSNAVRTFHAFKKQFSLWQDGFSPYQDFLTKNNLKK